jgi:hypothetical protein
VFETPEVIKIRGFLDKTFKADLGFFEGLKLFLDFLGCFFDFRFFFFDFGVSLDIERNLFLQ